jgi:hypothetical protein
LNIKKERRNKMKNKDYMRFIERQRYWSEDKYEMYVVRRFDNTELLRVEIGFGLPANYRLRQDVFGREYIQAKGHIFRA